MPYVASNRLAERSSSMGGMTPADSDVTEVHGFFTGVDLIGYEDLGPTAVSAVTILEGPVARGR